MVANARGLRDVRASRVARQVAQQHPCSFCCELFGTQSTCVSSAAVCWHQSTSAGMKQRRRIQEKRISTHARLLATCVACIRACAASAWRFCNARCVRDVHLSVVAWSDGSSLSGRALASAREGLPAARYPDASLVAWPSAIQKNGCSCESRGLLLIAQLRTYVAKNRESAVVVGA